MPDPRLTPIRRALISVSDKSGLEEFGRFLNDFGVEILSTGGSAKKLRDAGIPVTEVSDHTGFPEILDGRVKTLHPLIHGGLLGRRDDPAHIAAMKKHGIAPIDLLVVNLYPFEETIAKDASFDDCIENIDIGGPALLRAASKNHAFVTVITDAVDYAAVMAEMTETKGATTLALRRRLAATAYQRTAAYDSAIGNWFGNVLSEDFPRRVTFSGELRQTLRYGENPHQQAAFYVNGAPRPGVATAKQIQGKELSYNNLNDTDAAFELVAEFNVPAIAIIKHANPCGVATAENLKTAWDLALRCDPVSAFGGIIATNRTLDAATAEEIVKLFMEVVIAPDIDEEAREILKAKKNLRVLLTTDMPDPTEAGFAFRDLANGFLLQGRDNGQIDEKDITVVTKRQPTEKELADLLFAFTIAKHVKSNAIVYTKDLATVGIGAGQMSRIDSSRIAAHKASEAARIAGMKESLAQGSVVASDAFFPFADGLLAAAEAGATAVIQPGGSIRDKEVIAAADEQGLAMVFTGMRHFRH
ncbi:MAG: bifunctional phosphoribosylaminoimidazolecarboxamide formyltransferase/inosine monophosphate cyclohydrolase [Rhodospirillaceae bacterium]|nr:MAG: bifunctional phosphoribosylaminoimidazolecarboxamide formyltransferase/inosine monophosphate cyclohydrolase [Rhodospirillaceae bacterium]